MHDLTFLPRTWTPIARSSGPMGRLCWRFLDHWTQDIVDDLRDRQGRLLTAQKRGRDGVMVLLARAARV